jgi:hypothetical protein
LISVKKKVLIDIIAQHNQVLTLICPIKRYAEECRDINNVTVSEEISSVVYLKSKNSNYAFFEHAKDALRHDKLVEKFNIIECIIIRILVQIKLKL